MSKTNPPRLSPMLTFTGPSCHKHLKGPEVVAGRNVRCPSCHDVITVPEAPATTHRPSQPHDHGTQSRDLHLAVPSEELQEANELSHGPNTPEGSATLKAEDSNRLVDSVPDPESDADLASHIDPRSTYFAPSGYAASDPRAVPFMAPELCRRLKFVLDPGRDVTPD